jgi:GNAT superfamily N-acetyltransferase
MDIITATPDDLPLIARLGRLFAAEAGLAEQGIHYAEEAVETRLGQLLASGTTEIFLAVNHGGIQGMLGMALTPCLFSHDRIATELFWWVRPQSPKATGMRLYLAAEAWAKACGATLVSMVALQRVNPEYMHNLYQKMGFSLNERVYLKRL